MSCETDLDCSSGYSCRSKSGGGTECRNSEVNLSSNFKTGGNYEQHTTRNIRYVDKIAFAIDGNAPFTGIFSDYYTNGQKKKDVAFKDGKANGLSTSWFENGNKEFELNFKDGKLDGSSISYFENGDKEHELYYKNGEVVINGNGTTVNDLNNSGNNFVAAHSQLNENKQEIEKIVEKEKEKEKVQISDSGFEKEITFMGLVKTYKTHEGLERLEQAIERAGHKMYPNNYYFIRSWLIKNTGAVIHQLYVSYGYTGADSKYVDWCSANDENANTLNVVSISKNRAVDSSYGMIPYKFIEIVGVELSNELLKANKNTGFRVKLKSKKSTNSDRVISVTAEQIAAQLDAVETKRKEMFPNDKMPKKQQLKH